MLRMISKIPLNSSKPICREFFVRFIMVYVLANVHAASHIVIYQVSINQIPMLLLSDSVKSSLHYHFLFSCVLMLCTWYLCSQLNNQNVNLRKGSLRGSRSIWGRELARKAGANSLPQIDRLPRRLEERRVFSHIFAFCPMNFFWKSIHSKRNSSRRINKSPSQLTL